MEPLLELKNISHAYHTKGGETSALSNLSFQVFPGEFLAIIGPSGCGKTTILSIIAGLIPAESGEVLFKGKPMPKQNKELGYMLQKDQLFEWRSIYKNVTLGIELQRTIVITNHPIRICRADLQERSFIHSPACEEKQEALGIILYDKMLFHPLIKAISWSISCSVMSAVNEKRIREVPSGTVGGRTGNA